MYRKEFYVFNQTKPLAVTIRNYEQADFSELIRIQQECFPPPFPAELWWNTAQLTNHTTLFPEGALCIEVDGKLAGSMTALLTDFHLHDADHTWEDITDNGYIQTHNPNGNTLYVVDLCVSPSYRNLGLGKWLMFSMYDLVIQRKLQRLLGGCRMPGYHHYEKDLTAQQYVQTVLNGEIKDSVISFLLRCGRVLMEWKNPFIH